MSVFLDYDDCDGDPWSVLVFVHADAAGESVRVKADVGSHDSTRSPFDRAASLILDAPEVTA